MSVDDPFLNKDTLFRDVQDYLAFEGWEQYVKRYYDLGYPLRFTCTSSVAALLKGRSPESLVGRLSSMQVHPFSLSEAVALRGMAEERARSMLTREGRGRHSTRIWT